MEKLIPYEHWKPLYEHAQLVNQAGNQLKDSFAVKRNPPQEELLKYAGEFGKFVNILRETREKCAAIRFFLDHDFNNYLAPLSLMLATVERGKKDKLQLIKKYLFVNGVIKHVVGATRYYVDGVLDPQPIDLQEMLEEERPALENAFGNSKVALDIPAVRVNIHEDTVANLLFNMARTAGRKGQAENLRIEAEKTDQIRLMVSDDGLGIDTGPGEDNPAGTVGSVLFQDLVRDGKSGLALANLKDRMRAMGGDVFCFGHGGLPNQKTAQKGTLFCLVLPKAE